MADIRNVETLQALDPWTVMKYLWVRGWYSFETIAGGKAALWIKDEGDATFDVLVPYDRDVRDYAHRISELLQTVAIQEHRSASEVYDEILRAQARLAV